MLTRISPRLVAVVLVECICTEATACVARKLLRKLNTENQNVLVLRGSVQQDGSMSIHENITDLHNNHCSENWVNHGIQIPAIELSELSDCKLQSKAHPCPSLLVNGSGVTGEHRISAVISDL